MVDPLKGVSTHITVQQEHPAWVYAINNGIYTEDVSLVDRSQPPVVTGVVDETGSELTPERRAQIMASLKRSETDEKDFRLAKFEQLGKREEYGESAVKLRPKRTLFVPPRKLDEQTVEKTTEEMRAVEQAIAAERALKGGG